MESEEKTRKEEEAAQVQLEKQQKLQKTQNDAAKKAGSDSKKWGAELAILNKKKSLTATEAAQKVKLEKNIEFANKQKKDLDKLKAE